MASRDPRRYAVPALAAACLAVAVVWVWPARADVQVNERKDVIELTDGEKVEGIIIMETRGAVVIVEKESARQRVIAREDIAKITRGALLDKIAGYKTEEVGSHKIIVGEGFRSEEKPKDTDPTTKPQPTPSVTTPKVTVSKSELQKAKDLLAAYRTRFPALRDAVDAFLGAERMAELMSQPPADDPAAMDRYREIFTRLTSDSELPHDTNPKDRPTKPRPPRVKPNQPAPGPLPPKEHAPPKP